MKKNCLLWLLVAAMAMTSCQDEFIKNENKTFDKIGYAVETNSISEPLKSRASRSTDNTDVAIEDMGQTLGGKPLYLHTVTDMVMPMDIKVEKKKNDSKNAQSRAAETTTAGVTDIGVTSIVWNGDSWEKDATERKLYMDNVLAEKPNFQTNYYWPAAEQRIRFFAYSPETAGDIEVSDDRTTLTFDYIVPNSGADGTNDALPQVDLLVASSDEPADKKAEAPLFFGHALTAVQFKLATDITGVKVTAVRIKGVKYKGTYTYNYCGHNSNDGDGNTPDTDTGTWSVEDDIYTGTDGEGFEITGLEATSGIINDGANTFMMMPQTLPANATIEVDVIDTSASENAETQTLTAIIGGNNKVWQKGTKVIYTVSFNTYNEKYILQISDGSDSFSSTSLDGGTFDFYGGYGNYAIRSYKKITKLGNSTPDYKAVKWAVDKESIVGLDELTGMSGSGLSDTNGDGVVDDNDDALTSINGPYKFGVLPGEISNANSHKALVEIGEHGTADEPLDLSKMEIIEWKQTNLRNTANCYVVRGYGYFRFPLVYGNAIKDNNINVVAYKPVVGVTTVTESAVKYKNTNVGKESTPTNAADNTNGSITVEVLQSFRDHAFGHNGEREGNEIRNAWIADQAAEFNKGKNDYDENYEFGSAEIIWQDAPCLVTDLKIEQFDEGGTKRDFITFRVPKDVVCAGNAVIALKNNYKDGPQVMWSWHIWVTNEGYYQAPKSVINRRVLGNYSVDDIDATKWTREESEFKLFQGRLGHCAGETKTYAGRDNCQVTIRQLDDEGNEIINSAVTITCKVNGGSITTEDCETTYQWGRKDPMLPFYRMNGTIVDKTFYDNDRIQHEPHADMYNPENLTNTPVLVTYKGRKHLSQSIQYPMRFIRQTDNGGAAEVGTPPSNQNTANTDNVAYRNWCKTNYINLWNANCTALPMFSSYLGQSPTEYHSNFDKIVAIPVEKTVYDPCPPGFEMPRIDAFTGAVFDGTKAKPYYVFVNGTTKMDNTSAESYFKAATMANIGTHHLYDWNTVANYTHKYEIAFGTKPMPALGTTDIEDLQNGIGAYYTFGLGHRGLDGKGAQYANYGSALTSGMACIQWIADDGEHSTNYPANFYLHGIRFAFMHGYQSEYKGGHGTLKPMSGSTLDLSFGVIPVKTGSNPIKTEVKVGGDINQWVDGDHIDVEF